MYIYTPLTFVKFVKWTLILHKDIITQKMDSVIACDKLETNYHWHGHINKFWLTHENVSLGFWNPGSLYYGRCHRKMILVILEFV